MSEKRSAGPVTRTIFELVLETKEQFDIIIELFSFMKTLGCSRLTIDRERIGCSISIGDNSELVFDALIDCHAFGEEKANGIRAGYFFHPDMTAVHLRLPELALLLKIMNRCKKMVGRNNLGLPLYIVLSRNANGSYFLNIAGEVAMRVEASAIIPRCRQDVGAWTRGDASAFFWSERKKLLKLLKEASEQQPYVEFDVKPNSLTISNTDIKGNSTFSSLVPFSQYRYKNRGPVKSRLEYLWTLIRFLRASKAETANIDIFANYVQLWLGSHSHSRTVLILKCTSIRKQNYFLTLVTLRRILPSLRGC